jgi:hypothetical protein
MRKMFDDGPVTGLSSNISGIHPVLRKPSGWSTCVSLPTYKLALEQERPTETIIVSSDTSTTDIQLPYVLASGSNCGNICPHSSSVNLVNSVEHPPQHFFQRKGPCGNPYLLGYSYHSGRGHDTGTFSKQFLWLSVKEPKVKVERPVCRKTLTGTAKSWGTFQFPEENHSARYCTYAIVPFLDDRESP